MSPDYRDMLHREHPVSRTRARMSMADRAAQFAPFDALTGYGDAVREAARLTDTQRELDESEKQILDRKLRILANSPGQLPVCVTYFLPDRYKDGGEYVSVRGYGMRVDPLEQQLYLSGGEVIPLGAIAELTLDGY